MSNGLFLSLDEFQALPEKQKLNCLYLNQVKTLEMISGYKLYYKITSSIGGILLIGMGILFSFHFGV